MESELNCETDSERRGSQLFSSDHKELIEMCVFGVCE